MDSYPVIQKRRTNKLPYGYDPSPDDPKTLLPDVDTLDTLSVVLEYLESRSLSFRDAAVFLSDTTGRKITYEGLRQLFKRKSHPIYDI